VAKPEVEIADIGRLARRLVTRAVETARAEDRPLRRVLLEHLGPSAAALPTVSATWPTWDHVNVQVGLDAWLAASPGRRHEVVGISGAGMARHMDVTISDFLQSGPLSSAGATGAITEAVACGPGGQTRACVINGIYLVSQGDDRLAVMVLPVSRGPRSEIVVQVAGLSPGPAEAALAAIRELALAGSVFRGQVLSFGPELLGPGWGSAPLNFLERPAVDRTQVILPPGLLTEIERQVLGIRRHSGRLLASGQHLRRGVLLHGAPGTGKTHTVSYLLSQLPGVTAVVISGRALGAIVQACSLARSLQPSVVVIEDVDLIAEERAARPGQQPLLFQLMNEMEGLNSADDVTFLLTTNRADLLEPALAARPGRVDLAADLPLPDADARRALIRLYQGRLVLDTSPAGLDDVIARTEGVTAPFLKELLRRAALLSAESDPDPAADQPIRVADEHLAGALNQLLDERGPLTRALLGGGRQSG